MPDSNETLDLKNIESSSADKRVVEVYRYLKRYKDDPDRVWWLNEVYEKSWKAAQENELWEEDEKAAMTAKDQIPLAVNDMAKGVQGSSAVVTASKPGIVVSPIGRDDLYVKELLQRYVDFVMEQNGGQQRIFKLAKHCKLGAIAFFDVHFDNSKGMFGKTVIKNPRPTDLYWDKNSEEDDLSDVPIIKARLITRKYARENYPGIKDEELDFSPVSIDTAPGKSSGVPGKDNYAIEDSKRAGGGESDDDEKKNIWEIEAYLPKKKKQFWVITVFPEDEAQPWILEKIERKVFDKKQAAEVYLEGLPEELKPMSTIWERNVEIRTQRIIVGSKLIEEKDNPYGIDPDGEPLVPIIPLQHDETLRGYPVSPSFFAIGVSKERNKRRMQSIYVVTKNLEAPIVTGEGFRWEKDEKYGDMLIVGANNPIQPQRLLPGTTTSEALRLEQMAHEDIKNIYDTQDVMIGKMPDQRAAWQTIQALQDLGGMMARPFTTRLEAAIAKLAKVILVIGLRHWTRTQWKRLIEQSEWGTWQPDKEKKYDDETGKPVEVDQGEIAMKWKRALDIIAPLQGEPQIDIIDLDVKVAAGSTMPTSRIAKRQEAIEMKGAGIYDAEAALNYIDDPMKDEVSERMKKREELQMKMMMEKQAEKLGTGGV